MGNALRYSSVVAAIAAVALVASSGASGAVITRSDAKKIDEPLEIAKLTARCPQGMKATGGGYKAPKIDASPIRLIVVFESTKFGQSAWRVQAQLTNGSAAGGRVKAFVYCDRNIANTQTAKKTVEVNGSNITDSAKARCTGSDTVKAGGFSTPPPAYAGPGNPALNVVAGSQPAGSDAWKVTASSGFSFSTFPSEFTSYAYCSRGNAPDRKSGSKTLSNPFGRRDFKRGSAKSKECRRDAIAGGFSQKPIQFGTEPRLILLVYASIARGSRWIATGGQQGAGAGAAKSKLKSIALCG